MKTKLAIGVLGLGMAALAISDGMHSVQLYRIEREQNEQSYWRMRIATNSMIGIVRDSWDTSGWLYQDRLLPRHPDISPSVTNAVIGIVFELKDTNSMLYYRTHGHE